MTTPPRPSRHTGTRPPSSIDVARLAGVSQSAVSRAFTEGGKVSAETREKIVQAAREIGYTPTSLPRILQTGRSSIVAIVVGGFYNPFFATTLEAFMGSLRRSGNQVMLVQGDSDRELDTIVEELARYRVDAIVSALAIRSQAVADTLNGFRIPIVTLNSGISGDYIRTVSSDNHAAGIRAAAEFAARGRRRLGYLAGTDSPPQAARQAGFSQGAKEAGLSQPKVEIAGFDYGDGRRGVLALLDEPERPDAIFCVNDLVACGAMDGLVRDLGLRVPEDVLIIGYDDIPMAAWAPYELTTFNQNIAALVEGVEAMLSPQVEQDRLLVAPTLIERRSASPSG